MFWYDFRLGGERVSKLTDLFSSSPFRVEKNVQHKEYRVFIREDATEKFLPYCIISYGIEEMAIYPTMIEHLPESIQADLIKRVGAVEGLEEVVKDLKVSFPSSV